MTQRTTPTTSRSDRWRPDLICIDGRHMLFRTSDAHRDLIAETDNGPVQTGGVYGSLMIMAKLRRRYNASMLVAWEGTGNFRYKAYPDYKKRPEPTPGVATFRSELQQQEIILRGILSSLGVRQYESVGGEADDVLGTLAEMARGKELNVGIFTGDSDLQQMVNDYCRVLSPIKGGSEKVWDAYAVGDKWDVRPDRLPLLKALAGDSSDNVPGLPGIGPKTAAAFINKYDTLEAILAAATSMGNWAFTETQRAKVLKGAGDLATYLNLTTIRRDIEMKAHPVRRDALAARKTMAKLKFRRLLEHAQFTDLKRLAF